MWGPHSGRWKGVHGLLGHHTFPSGLRCSVSSGNPWPQEEGWQGPGQAGLISFIPSPHFPAGFPILTQVSTHVTRALIFTVITGWSTPPPPGCPCTRLAWEICPSPGGRAFLPLLNHSSPGPGRGWRTGIVDIPRLIVYSHWKDPSEDPGVYTIPGTPRGR